MEIGKPVGDSVGNSIWDFLGKSVKDSVEKLEEESVLEIGNLVYNSLWVSICFSLINPIFSSVNNYHNAT